MAKVLIQFAHPALEKSRVHKAFIEKLKQANGFTFNDLYERYPDFDIDIDAEQRLLEAHDIIVLQHPLYWYSAPAMMKQWVDLVLEHGWAYGKSGNALQNKTVLHCISCGGSLEAYSPGGRNGHTIRGFLLPFEQTARLCKMNFEEPFVVYGTHKLGMDEIQKRANDYLAWLKSLQEKTIKTSVAI